jgi:hypothetical protein
MIFGPLPTLFADKLKALLDEQNATYKLFFSEEELEQLRMLPLQQGIRSRPVFTGLHDYIYIDIPDEHLPIVKSELENMVGPLNTKYAGELDGPSEYLCTKCDFISTNPGLCPKHHIRLLEFSDWNKARAEDSTKGTRIAVIVLLILLASWIYFSVLKL